MSAFNLLRKGEMMPESMREAIEKVTEHEEMLKELKEQDAYLLKGHDALFEWKKDMEKWRQDSDANYHDLKSTILLENKETRTFFQSIMDKQWDLIKSRDTSFENEKVRRHDFQKSKLEKYSEIIIKVAGAGGILVLIAQLLFGK